jgi:hypothetical protein
LDELKLFAGLMLPWLVGMAVLVSGLRARVSLAAPGEFAWIAGAGYLVGAFLLTLWMRALSLAGVPFSVFAVGAPLLAATMAAGYYAWRRDGDTLPRAVLAALRAFAHPPGLEGTTRLAWRLLLAWLALRFIMLGFQVSWQPLYPWDAWIGWATKARVWYELGRIVPFAGADAWFAADGGAYFDAAPGYPPTVPLLQVWACIVLGRWDDALMNWPWWQIAAALAFAVYGALRALSMSALGALVTAFFVASLPLANVHVALAGYADLPMAAFYTCAVLALLRWAATRDARDAALVALLAVACTQIKNPGLAWALTLVPGVIVVLLPRLGLKLAVAGLGAMLFLLAVLAQTSTSILGYRLHLDFEPAWAPLRASYFLLGNWNLLWYGVFAAAFLAGRQLASQTLAPMTIIVTAGAVLLFVVVSLTNASAWVADQTTASRATLHFAPVAAVFAALAFRAFAVRWANARPTADAPGA